MAIALLIVGTMREAICLRCGRFLGAAPICGFLIKLARLHACEGEGVLFVERHGKPSASAGIDELKRSRRA